MAEVLEKETEHYSGIRLGSNLGPQDLRDWATVMGVLNIYIIN